MGRFFLDPGIRKSYINSIFRNEGASKNNF